MNISFVIIGTNGIKTITNNLYCETTRFSGTHPQSSIVQVGEVLIFLDVLYSMYEIIYIICF